MDIVLNISLVVVAFLAMEGVAWATHKYIMHGVLWNWHQSHHTLHRNRFEKNDLFGIVFSIPAMACIMVGNEVESLRFLFYIGLGITGYGIFYVIFHDIIVHRRIKIKFKAQHSYLKRMMNAHYIHHQVHSKEGAEAFGFLYAPAKYEAKEKK